MIIALLAALVFAAFCVANYRRQQALFAAVIAQEVERSGGQVVWIKRASPIPANDRLYLLLVDRAGARVRETWRVDPGLTRWIAQRQ